MRAVVQRVTAARVVVENNIVGEIGHGLLVFLGVARGDEKKDIDFMLRKIPHLRIFDDEEGNLNRSLMDIEGHMMVVSQFTLYGDCRRGLRPSFDQAASPALARELYQAFIAGLESKNIAQVEQGVFGAYMKVEICNDGPVTIVLDSREGSKT